MHNIDKACDYLLSQLNNTQLTDSRMWQVDVNYFDESLLRKMDGCIKTAFKSRDKDFYFLGFGASDIIKGNSLPGIPKEIEDKIECLNEHQFYFSALRFDEQAQIADEWKSFGQKIFILPLLCLIKDHDGCRLQLNYTHNSHMPSNMWREHAINLLSSIKGGAADPVVPIVENEFIVPDKENYLSMISSAIREVNNRDGKKKVVLGRKKVLELKGPNASVDIYMHLSAHSSNTHMFYVDLGMGSAFFGASPELLYRRCGDDLVTEALAGTRARSLNTNVDNDLRNELLDSIKDNCEHALVDEHITSKLEVLSDSKAQTSKLDIMPLSYVQHLLRKYTVKLDTKIKEQEIVSMLNPTPAVAGLDREWAISYIRESENFDRGFYAGPIGVMKKNYTEFSVAIRSALYHDNKLHIFAAGGIVEGSIPDKEWQELEHKEKTILNIFGAHE